MNGEYPHMFDQPWQWHPDGDTPINVNIPDTKPTIEQEPPF